MPMSTARAQLGIMFSDQQIRLRDLLPKSVAQYSYVVTEGSFVYKPVCNGSNAFARARIMLYPYTNSWRSTPNITQQVIFASTYDGQTFVGNTGITAATDDIVSAVVANTPSASSSYWVINWVGTSVSPYAARRAIAQTFCYYGN